MVGPVLASLLAPTTLIDRGGLLLVGLIVFAETGLLAGFFLPGDSLLFIAGFLSSPAGGQHLPPLPVVIVFVFVAAVVGDQVGYLIGLRLGPALFRRPDSRLFKQQNVVRAHQFFERHGSKTIVLARFVPVVRTFATVMAGAAGMDLRRFALYSVIGGVAWTTAVTLLGFWLGQVALVRDHVELFVLGIVALSLVPVAVETLRRRSRS
jgi:membrane-associated protein